MNRYGLILIFFSFLKYSTTNLLTNSTIFTHENPPLRRNLARDLGDRKIPRGVPGRNSSSRPGDRAVATAAVEEGDSCDSDNLFRVSSILEQVSSLVLSFVSSFRISLGKIAIAPRSELFEPRSSICTLSRHLGSITRAYSPRNSYVPFSTSEVSISYDLFSSPRL